MRDVEIDAAAMDRLLHSPTGPVGKYLRTKADQVADDLEEEAQNVMKGFSDFVKEPEIRSEAGELVAVIEARSSQRMEQRLSRKAEEERLNSWMGRGLKRSFSDVR